MPVPGPASRPVVLPDLDREHRIVSQISDAILDGEPVMLEGDDGHRFFALYTEATIQPSAGSVVILHGRGLHPDWVNAIHPLRVGLAEGQWNTLSIQLPVLDSSAKYYDYEEIFAAALPRIDAAIEAARAWQPGPVVLLAHSCGFHMAQHWMQRRGEAALGAIDAFVGIGMGATDYGQPMRVPFVLDRIPVPVLDVYAEYDYPAVQRLADQRWKLMQQAGNPKSARRIVANAEHYYVDRGDALVDVVREWLDSL